MIKMRHASTSGFDDGILFGTGAGLAIVALLVLESATTSGIFGTSTETPGVDHTYTTTVTATSVSTMQCNESMTPITIAFDNYLLNIQSGNYVALMGDFLNNATLQVVTHLPSDVNQISATDAEGVAGQYDGGADASTFTTTWIANTFNQEHNMTMIILSFNAQDLKTNSTISLNGFGDVGQASATIVMQMGYVQVGDNWLISGGTWTLTNYVDRRVIITG
jgi:hypothetical protein